MRTPAKLRIQKPRIAAPFTFPAPTRGWIANENLADPTPGGAAMLENWFPTATGSRVRAGSELYATLGDGSLPTKSLFSYLNGPNQKFFGATDSTIFDITTVFFPDLTLLVDDLDNHLVTDTGDTIGYNSTDDLDVYTGQTGGDWVVVQFATTGGVYLLGVNGQDNAFIYDGQYFYPLSDKAVSQLAFDNQTGPFSAGQVLTGGTSGATGTIQRVIDNGTTGLLVLQNVVGGPFQNNEAITTPGGGAALANGASEVIMGALTGIPTSSFSYVWIYKNRLWFIEKESLNAWYLPVDSIAGAATRFPLGGVLGRGGSLLFGSVWSLDSGADGGLSEQCTFVSTEGEVAVYQGSTPGGSGDFSKVGVYRIGRPLGAKAHQKAGGDLVICTDIGFVPLSQAIQRDVAALSPTAVSYPIETAWNERVAFRSSQPWQCEIWPTKQMTAIALPTVANARPEMLVANARTGAWALYTGWNGTCLEVFKDRLFFGSIDGKVIEAEVTGADEGAPYTATCVPLFSDMGASSSLKTAGMARAVLLSPYTVNDQVSLQADFTISLPPPPDAAAIGDVSVWGLGVWSQSTWGSVAEKKTFQAWKGVGGSGYAMSVGLQITSGNVPPPTIDLVRMELTTMAGDVFS